MSACWSDASSPTRPAGPHRWLTAVSRSVRCSSTARSRRAIALEDVEAHPPVLVELVDLEQPELLQRPAVQALALGATVGSRVGESVVEAFVADRRPEQGLDLEQAFPIPLEQPIGRGPVVSHRCARSPW